MCSVLYGLGQCYAQGEIVGVGLAWSARGMFFEFEQCVVEHAHDHPVAGAVLVEACGVDRCVEAGAYAVAHALSTRCVGEFIPAVPEQGSDLVVRVAAHWFGVDRQPFRPVGA